jgi:hypothetical protein
MFYGRNNNIDIDDGNANIFDLNKISFVQFGYRHILEHAKCYGYLNSTILALQKFDLKNTKLIVQLFATTMCYNHLIMERILPWMKVHYNHCYNKSTFHQIVVQFSKSRVG